MADSTLSNPTEQDTIAITPGNKRSLNETTTNAEHSVSSPDNSGQNENPIQRKKRAKTSIVWTKFVEMVVLGDSISNCLMEWGIENKVYTISVDNVLSNDVAIRILRKKFKVMGNLIRRGKLFHVRCCAHILKLIVQDGFYQIRHIIDDIHESVLYINASESWIRVFTEIVQQLKLMFQKLILHCKTRWNSTYEMLAMAIKFKKVFPKLKETDLSYHYCEQDEDWEKVEKVCDILNVFSGTTNLISGSDYLTSNLFLNEVYLVKMMLDSKSEDEDEFIRNMVRKMKDKFYKYWGECRVLMCVVVVLDL
ncbi:zinc finger BED domain-containing protein RICESLEEPER 1-like [Pistacia vera]|uniref:zinc finger BED domain-containing protein RICESLEEPER 1-like n=1 Tax=Pistacia vera TaxID=55513 RepID=UPI001262E614|nr:zinc finger BED domain-containing protein RICESLEEPER 1-like [Pistacia vera]